MLNRGDAPSAQLFAISEQAEIRYTNNGLLYEVPADEAVSTPMRSGSSSAREEVNHPHSGYAPLKTQTSNFLLPPV